MLLLTFSSYALSQENYTKVPRTRVSMIIPDGYSIMTNNTGLQKDVNQAIMIMDLVGGNYYTNAKDFQKSTFEQQGLAVYEFEDTKVSGYPAKFMISGTDDWRLNALTMVFGDSTFSTMITSVHYANDNRLQNSLKDALLSVRYDKEVTIDPFEGIRFSVDTVSTRFKFSLFSSNMYVFTPGGDNEPEDKSMVMLTPTLFDKSMSIEQLSQMAMNGLIKHGMYGFITNSETKYDIEGTTALLKTGDCYAGVEHLYYHQLILARDDIALMVYGMCDNNDLAAQSAISEFCRLIRITN